MTVGRISRVSTETLIQSPEPEGRVSHVSAETLVRDPAPRFRISRVSVETLIRQPVAPEPSQNQGGWGIPILSHTE